MKKLLYLFPYNLGCAGVDVKVRGQIAALSSIYNVELITLLSFEKEASVIERIIKLFFSQFIFMVATFRNNITYYRYSPFMPLYNLMLIIISFFSVVWIEHNTVVRYELKENWSWVIALHRIQIFSLKLSRAKHIAVTEEIKREEKLPQKTIVMPNGYLRTNNLVNDEKECNDERLANIIDAINNIKNQGKKVVVFVGNDYPWNGLDRIADLVERMDHVFLIVIGSMKQEHKIQQLVIKDKCCCIGFLNPEYLPLIYEKADFGIGTFALDKKEMIEACPLKVREYLWFGLPVIINYNDSLLGEVWSKDFVHKVDWSQISKTQNFIDTNFTRAQIREEAQNQLNWKTVFQKAGVLREKEDKF